jgi:uncharacterized DUF497 family protein
MSIVEFIWDEENTRHLARHKITPSEAEETIQIDPLVQDMQEHATEDRVLVFGRTTKGRLLTIIYTVRSDAIRVVTGYRMPKWQQHIYFEGR